MHLVGDLFDLNPYWHLCTFLIIDNIEDYDDEVQRRPVDKEFLIWQT